MKKLIPAIIAAALLSGCATQNDAVALSNRISDQQKQINAAFRSPPVCRASLESAGVSFSLRTNAEQQLLLPERRHLGSVFAGRICDGSSGSVAWRLYSHR